MSALKTLHSYILNELATKGYVRAEEILRRFGLPGLKLANRILTELVRRGYARCNEEICFATFKLLEEIHGGEEYPTPEEVLQRVEEKLRELRARGVPVEEESKLQKAKRRVSLRRLLLVRLLLARMG